MCFISAFASLIGIPIGITNPQKNERMMLLSKFIKQQEASGLLSCLGIRTPLSKISLVGPILFQ